MWTIAKITDTDGENPDTFAAIHDGKRAVKIGTLADALLLRAALDAFILSGGTTSETIGEYDNAFGVCWISAGEAARRYGVAKSTARYRMSVDPRAVKRDGSWWMPEEIVRQEWTQ